MLGETLAPYFRRAMAVAVLALGLTGAAHAQDSKSYPGTMCVTYGSQQTLSHGDTSIANRSASTRRAVCPIVRDNLELPWERLIVFVDDRHAMQDICCEALANDEYGGAGASATLCSSGTGQQPLAFAALPAGTLPEGPYSVVCDLPPTEAGMSSLITSYRVYEP